MNNHSAARKRFSRNRWWRSMVAAAAPGRPRRPFTNRRAVDRTTRRRVFWRTADGKPDLTAPTPRTADGKPDLSGIWAAEDNRPCPAGGCADMAVGQEFLDIGWSLKGGLPYLPWAAAAVKSGSGTLARTITRPHCLPSGVVKNARGCPPQEARSGARAPPPPSVNGIRATGRFSPTGDRCRWTRSHPGRATPLAGGGRYP